MAVKPKIDSSLSDFLDDFGIPKSSRSSRKNLIIRLSEGSQNLFGENDLISFWLLKLKEAVDPITFHVVMVSDLKLTWIHVWFFCGVKMIPLGIHFVYYSSLNLATQSTAPRTGWWDSGSPGWRTWWSPWREGEGGPEGPGLQAPTHIATPNGLVQQSLSVTNWRPFPPRACMGGVASTRFPGLNYQCKYSRCGMNQVPWFSFRRKSARFFIIGSVPDCPDDSIVVCFVYYL